MKGYYKRPEERMAGYKYPRLIEITAALPMNATGKSWRSLRDRK
jgi:hypothetical protein